MRKTLLSAVFVVCCAIYSTVSAADFGPTKEWFPKKRTVFSKFSGTFIASSGEYKLFRKSTSEYLVIPSSALWEKDLRIIAQSEPQWTQQERATIDGFVEKLLLDQRLRRIERHQQSLELDLMNIRNAQSTKTR